MLKEIARILLFFMIFTTLEIGGIRHFSFNWWVMFAAVIALAVVSELK